MDTITTAAIGRIERQLSLAEIAEQWTIGAVHYVMFCKRNDTGFYTIRCSCGWFTDTGKSGSGAHSLMRSHVAGHQQRVADDDA